MEKFITNNITWILLILIGFLFYLLKPLIQVACLIIRDAFQEEIKRGIDEWKKSHF
jgi:hypothetical protein